MAALDLLQSIRSDRLFVLSVGQLIFEELVPALILSFPWPSVNVVNAIGSERGLSASVDDALNADEAACGSVCPGPGELLIGISGGSGLTLVVLKNMRCGGIDIEQKENIVKLRQNPLV